VADPKETSYVIFEVRIKFDERQTKLLADKILTVFYNCIHHKLCMDDPTSTAWRSKTRSTAWFRVG
jgi:hypothetical protein